MAEGQARLPKPEVRGTGTVRYRCAGCGEMMDPKDALIVEGLSYHPEHEPEKIDGR